MCPLMYHFISPAKLGYIYTTISHQSGLQRLGFLAIKPSDFQSNASLLELRNMINKGKPHDSLHFVSLPQVRTPSLAFSILELGAVFQNANPTMASGTCGLG